jgi:hypothetical protein
MSMCTYVSICKYMYKYIYIYIYIYIWIICIYINVNNIWCLFGAMSLSLSRKLIWLRATSTIQFFSWFTSLSLIFSVKCTIFLAGVSVIGVQLREVWLMHANIIQTYIMYAYTFASFIYAYTYVYASKYLNICIYVHIHVCLFN